MKRRLTTTEKPASTTRLKPIVNSSTWMKSVVDDISRNRVDGTDVLRKKISSFTNPEKSKMRKILSLHTHESNDKGEQMMKILNNIAID